MNPYRHYSAVGRSTGVLTYLERIAAVCFSVNHFHDILMHRFPRLVSVTPVVRSTNAIFANEEVFRIVDVLVWSGLNAVDDLHSQALVN